MTIEDALTVIKLKVYEVRNKKARHKKRAATTVDKTTYDHCVTAAAICNAAEQCLLEVHDAIKYAAREDELAADPAQTIAAIKLQPSRN